MAHAWRLAASLVAGSMLQPAGLSMAGRLSIIVRRVAGAGPRVCEVMLKTAGSPRLAGPIGPFPVFVTVTSAHTTSIDAAAVSSASAATLGSVALATLWTPGQSDGNAGADTRTVSVFPAGSAGSLQVSTPP